MKLQVNPTVLKLLHQRISGENLLSPDRWFGLRSFPTRATNTRLSKNQIQRVTDNQKS